MGLSAQDVITKADGSKIDAKVEEITETSIRYRKSANPSGPIYNIPISAVVSIQYENGTTEKFASAANDVLPNYMNLKPSSAVSDEQLLRMNADSPQELYAKAKKYRKIGWIGGGTMAGLTLIAGIAMGASYGVDFFDGSLHVIGFFGSGLVAGSIWWLSFNAAAKSLEKKARAAELYSTTIVGSEIYRFGNKSLMAGVNVMGNQVTRTHGLGLSLSLNF